MLYLKTCNSRLLYLTINGGISNGWKVSLRPYLDFRVQRFEPTIFLTSIETYSRTIFAASRISALLQTSFQAAKEITLFFRHQQRCASSLHIRPVRRFLEFCNSSGSETLNAANRVLQAHVAKAGTLSVEFFQNRNVLKPLRKLFISVSLSAKRWSIILFLSSLQNAVRLRHHI